MIRPASGPKIIVAPLAGSVDRNYQAEHHPDGSQPESLPSRGAWIEIFFSLMQVMTSALVAPLAGSVDRNQPGAYLILADERSLPSRGAWIEMAVRC